MEHRAFENDIDFLEHEIAWVEARCRRLAAENDHEQDEEQHAYRTRTCCRRQNTAEVEVPENLASLRQYEADIRFEVDARVAATEAAGVVLGLHTLVREHDLDEADRSTLLLALVPCLGTRAVDTLEKIGTYAMAGSIAAEVVAVFNEFAFPDRLRRLRFDRTHKLVKAGLVTTDTADSAHPGAWPHSSLSLTEKAFGAMTGLAALSEP